MPMVNQSNGAFWRVNMIGKERLVITIMSGAEDGKEIEFEKVPITIGRLSDNDLTLPYDNRVSRHHAKITKEGKKYWIEDVGSTNGTHVLYSKEGINSEYVKITKKTSISSGAVFLVGSVWLKFVVGGK